MSMLASERKYESSSKNRVAKLSKIRGRPIGRRLALLLGGGDGGEEEAGEGGDGSLHLHPLLANSNWE